MAFGGFDPEAGRERQPPLADINMTPLIDVMLVLLVVFIIAAPLFSRAIALDLPKQDAAPSHAADTPSVAVAIDRTGQLFWNGEKIAVGDLDRRFAAAAKQQPQPDIALSADQGTAYRQITAVMAAAQHAGLSHFGFVVEAPAAAQK